MPVYRYNGDVYDVPQDKSREFESKFPDATVEMYSGDDVYDIPVAKQTEFLSQFSDARYSAPSAEEVTEEMQPQGAESKQSRKTSLFGPPPAPKKAQGEDSLPQYDEVAREQMRQHLEDSGTIERMEEMEKEARKAKRKERRQAGLMAMAAAESFAAGAPSTSVFSDLTQEHAKEWSQNKAMEQTLDVALDKARAGEWGGLGEDNVGNGVVDFGLGLWDSATRMSTWDFGVSDTLNGLTIAQVVKKWEEDPESLTATERNLLDAMGMATAVQEAYQDQVGIGYAVGESLPVSAGFMASMYLNPASGLGKAAARQAVKKYGRQSIAKNLARIGGDIAETAIMTATTGGGRVVADALDRINGQSTYEIDPETGIVIYGGQEDQKTVGEAVVKAIGSNFIENYSEALGEYFDPLLGMSRRVAAGGLRKMNLDKWADALSDVQPSQMAASVRSLREKAKFGGVFGEIMEEEVGMALNAITVGDYTFSKEEADASNGKKQWIFDLENQLTTALSCAIMSGTITGVETIGNVRYRRDMEKSVADSEKAARAAVGDEMIAQIDQASPEGMVDILRDAYMDQNLSLQQKRALAEYATQRVRMQYYNASDAKARRQVNVAQQNTIDAYEAGRHAQLPQYYNINQEYRRSEAAINERENAEEIWDAIRLMNNMDENERQNIMRDFSEEDQELIRNWRYNEYRWRGAINHRAEQVEDLVDEYRGQVTPYTRPDGTLTTAILGDDVVYVMNEAENGDAVVYTNDGRKIFCKMRDLEHVQQHNAEELIERFRQQTTEAVNQETKKNLSYPSEVQEPAQGVTVETLDGKQWQVAATDGENVEIVGLVFDKKSGQWIPNAGDYRKMTREQFMDWQKAELDRKKANTYEQGDELIFYVNGEPIDAEITGIDPEGNYYVHVSNLVEGLDKAVSDVYTAEELRKLTTPSSNVSEKTTEHEGTTTEEIKQSVSEEVTNSQIEDNVNEPTAEVTESVNEPQTIEQTVAGLFEEGLDDAELDDFVSYNSKAAVDKADKVLKKKPTMKDAKGDIAQYKALKAAWEEELNKANGDVLYWDNVAKEIARQREVAAPEAIVESPNENVAQEEASFVEFGDAAMEAANEILANQAPMNGVELAAAMLSGNGKRKIRLDPESFRRHTGYSTAEQRKFPGLFAKKENGGVSVERFGELVELADREDGTHFFEEGDVNAGLNAVLEVLGQAKTMKDINQYIARQREAAAYSVATSVQNQEDRAMQEAKDAWYMEQYHATEEELEAYREYLSEITEEIIADDANYEERFNTFAELIADEYDNQGTDADIRSSADQGERLASDREGSSSVGEGEETDRQGAVLGDASRFTEAEDGRAGGSISAQPDDRQARIDRAVREYWDNVDNSPGAVAAAERDQQRYEADMAEDAAEIVETLENGDVRRTNLNSNGEIATVVIERDGNVVSVDTYEDGALFERTDYDANGNATKVTRYKDGEVVSEQEYKDGKRKVTANYFEMAEEAQKKRKEKKNVRDIQEEEKGKVESERGDRPRLGKVSFSEFTELVQRLLEKAYSGVAPTEEVARIIREHNKGKTLLAHNANEQELLKALRVMTNEHIDGLLKDVNDALQSGEITDAEERKAYEDAAALIDRFKKRGERKAIVKALTGANLGEKLPLSKIDELFEMYNSDADAAELYRRVRAIAEQIGLDFWFEEGMGNQLGGYLHIDNRVRLNAHTLYSPYVSQQTKASNILHEMLHAVVGYAVKTQEDVKKGLTPAVKLSKQVLNAANTIAKIYEKAVKDNPLLVHEQFNPDTNEMEMVADYGTTSVEEMLVEISNPEFRDKLKQIEYNGRSVWQRIWGAIKSMLTQSSDVTNPTAYDSMSKALDVLINEFSVDAYRKYSGLEESASRVYHGSGAMFDKFDHSFMGTGEGNQSFGWGTYVSESNGVAKTYAEISARNVLFNSDDNFETVRKTSPSVVAATVVKQEVLQNNTSFADAKRMAEENFRFTVNDTTEEWDDDTRELAGRLADAAAALTEEEVENTPYGGFVYDVEIPDDNGSNYLKWYENVPKEVLTKAKAKLYGVLVEGDYKGAERELKRELDDLFALEQTGQNLYGNISAYLGSDKEASQFLHEMGYVGLKYPTNTLHGGNIDGTNNYVIFDENDLEIVNNIRFRDGAPFFSNAERAVENIKQNKATPEQWLAMIKKDGGLKAGEDKWMGLSDWLEEKKAEGVKTLTKDEVLQFIRENQIEIEEVEYGNNPVGFDELKEEYEAMLRDEGYDAAHDAMTDRYGDDFDVAFEDLGGELAIVNEEAAAALLGSENIISSTRLEYTTEGLDNKREIALVVPTIEPWNESDTIHFGDAGEGRAVAWVRFGETTTPREEKYVREVKLGEPYKNFSGDNVYPSTESKKDYIVHKTLRDGTKKFVPQVNERPIGNTMETAAFNTLEEAKEAMSAYYKERPLKKVVNERVLVIDEVQSKRHDEGRANGYGARDLKEKFKKIQKERQDFRKEHPELTSIPNDALYGRISAEEYDEWKNRDDIKALFDKEDEIEREYVEALDNLGKVPDAPFDKNYHELVMKRMLRYAAENGFDKVAWTKGVQQAQRYNLNKVFDSVEREDNPSLQGKRFVFSGTNTETIQVGGDGVVIDATIADAKGKTLESVVGVDMAKQMMSLENGDMVEGQDFAIGGEGMKGFYDEMIPRFMNKYTKKWGTKVGEVTLPEVEEAGRTMWSVDVTPEMKESVMQGQPMFREGMGAISDREVSYENDPIAKFQGKPRYYGKRAAAFAERERARMQKGVEEAAKILGIEVEIITDASTLKGRKAKAKGWYDINSKKVVVVVPNHVSKGDAVRTVLHEGVAHHGLRELFGDGFDAMLDNVYNNVAPELKARIDAIAERMGVSTSVATEEYLASLAEETNFEYAQRTGWWTKIKQFFVDMLNKLGMPGLNLKEELTDNELRYLLWRSYQNLVDPNSYMKPLGYIDDVAKQKELKVGEYAENTMATPRAAEMSEAEEWSAVTMQRIEELEAQAVQLENEIADMEADRDADDESRYDMWEEQLDVLRKQSQEIYDELEGLYSLEAEAEEMSMASEDAIRYRLVDDPAEIDRLESEPTIKAYRAMQVINGELYPPMSAVVDGKLREPIALGQWEQSEERPELADDNGRFKLDKGNKKSLKAAYNPYFHSSSTPLNDQFSEAQDRDNLVTVEVEVPVSEADGTSGYKAEKAKDAVGTHQWKAGIIQGQLTGTREVFLTRWDKPIRIVPESEVADVIVEMFDGKDIVMPSNVVTPQLRKELEARGITFVETDNQGKLVEGEHKGKHYSKVYGKKTGGLRYREGDDTRLMDALADAYASGDKKAIQNAVNDIIDAMRLEDADPSIGNLDWEKVEDYEGNNPRLLAAQYIVRAKHHLYLDEDYDTEYIKTGIKTVDAPINEVAEGDVNRYTNDFKNERTEAQRQFEKQVEESQKSHTKGTWLWNGLMSAEDIRERHQKMLEEFDGLLSEYQFDKAAEKLGEIRAWQNAAKKYIDAPYNEIPYVGEEVLIAEIEREAAALGVPVRIVRSVDELPDEDTRKRAVDGQLKGYFDPRTGEVVVYEPNTDNASDAKRTVLHEIVGHKGLRQLIGEQRYDKAMIQLMYMLPSEVRDAVLIRAERNGWNAAIAMDEYLAEQAERDVQPTWWGKVNAKIRALLRNIGFNVRLTDADVTYLLWRSRKKLMGDSAFDMATNAILKQAARKSAEADAWNEQAFKDAEMRDFEKGSMQRLRNRIGDAQNEYDSAMKSMAFKQRESWQDSMRSLKVFMDVVSKESGKKIADWENAYMYENAMSSANLMEMQMFRHDVYGRLLKAINELMESGAKYEEVVDYMMAKHGLERNEKMARKRAEKEAEGDAAKEAKLYAKYRGEDLSGLTALTGVDNVGDAEAAAMQMIADFEAKHNTDLLWNETRACTQTILNISHDAGILSDKVYDELWNQYEYYIPLRGFDETTAEEVYTYVGDNKSPYNAPIKTAKGRKSKADDPIATIATMAESAIVEANRNRLKHRFLYMVERHRTELASVSSVWVEKDPITGDCVARFANIPNDATPEEAAQAQKAFEERMEQLHEQEPERYYKASEKPNIPYRVEKKANEHEHQIIVKRNGKDVVITINGDPRVAQAVNGLTNAEAVEGFSKFAGNVNRFLSANFTTRNPAFVVANFVRDGFYTNSMVWAKESPAYAWKYNQNWAKATKLLPSLVNKYKRYEKGDKSSLDMSDPVERAFYEFMINGGETGYTVINSVEDYKGIVAGDLKTMQGGVVGNTKKAVQAVGEVLDTFGRWAEDTSRFAAFLTSREMGRSVTKSIWDAKEISVNFNKKGSGRKMTQHDKGLNSILGWMSQQGRNLYVFWNAGMQGMYNFGKAVKEHPGKMAGLAGVYFGLGMAIAAIFGGHDDDEDYWNLPEYVRRNNICFRAGNKFVTLPLPIELRAIYGMGELAMSWMAGKEDPKKVGMKVVQQMSQVMPIDMMADGGGLMAFVPSWGKPIVEVGVNTDWTGMPIYRKRTPWNEYDPQWMLAFKSTSPELVAASRAINEATNKNLPSGRENKYDRGWADIEYLNNPAAWEHIAEGYLGGLATTFNQTKKSVMAIWNEDLREVRNAPVVSRFLKDAGEKSEEYALREDYFNAKGVVDELRSQRGHFRKESIDPSLTEEQRKDVMESRVEMEKMVNATISQWNSLENARKKLEDMVKDNPDQEVTFDGKKGNAKDALDEVTRRMVKLTEGYQ